MDPAAPSLTVPQRVLLQSVAAGDVERLGAVSYYGRRYLHRPPYQRWQKVTARIQPLIDAGLVNPEGKPMRGGQPCSPEERFPDYHVVTLTPAGAEVLATLTSTP